MRLILVVLLFIPLMAISCIDKEFEKELKFVQSIINNPEEMKNIIEASEFYDSTFINLANEDFITEVNYLENKRSELTIDCYKKNITLDKEIFKDTKMVSIYHEGAEYSVIFIFSRIGKDFKLIKIMLLTK